MNRVMFVLHHQHNLLLVLVSLMVFVSACLVGFGGIDNAFREPQRRRICLCLASLATGLGVWCSYFIGMLAYDPGFDALFDVQATLVSAVFPVALAALGWRLALDHRPAMRAVGGGVIGLGAAGMPYLGTWAVRNSAHISWHYGLVAASLVLPVGLAAFAVWLHRHKARSGIVAWEGGSLLTLAICGGDFLVRAAADFDISAAHASVSRSAFGTNGLTIPLVIVALSIMGIGIKLITVQERSSRAELIEARHRAVVAEEIVRGAEQRDRLTAELRRQVDITEAAIEHMPQGLSMYDREGTSARVPLTE